MVERYGIGSKPMTSPYKFLSSYIKQRLRAFKKERNMKKTKMVKDVGYITKTKRGTKKIKNLNTITTK